MFDNHSILLDIVKQLLILTNREWICQGWTWDTATPDGVVLRSELQKIEKEKEKETVGLVIEGGILVASGFV